MGETLVYGLDGNTEAVQVLRQYFGHRTFRPGQEALLQGILAGHDVLGIMPTGGGKSLCYQVPAMLLPGITLVVSPLISLMKDQVAALTENGVPAAFLNSSLNLAQQQMVCRRLLEGVYRIVYVAPERLEAEGFLRQLATVEISLLAVDEAHCISQWGQDFRPSYLKILEVLKRLPRRPAVAAFTATATGLVQEDIARMLGLCDPVKVITGFDRPNLFFDVRRPKRKSDALRQLVSRRREQCGIVYCSTRAQVERVCLELCAEGFPATRYHAGLPEEERRENQEDFQYDRKRIMVATNAFGMGIDKSNVSYVIHYNMPKSIEAYYQEAGRAGRDGEAADCILLFAESDVNTARRLIENSGENEGLSPQQREQVLRQNQQRLEAMVRYCRSTGCYRGQLLDYFGQSHADSCGNCGNCRREFAEEDMTVQAQMILSCVQRIRNHLRYYVGQALVVETLRGSRRSRIQELGLDTLSTYGLLRGESRERVDSWIERLVACGYLRRNPRHGALELTEAAGNVLFHGESVTIPVEKFSERTLPDRAEASAPLPEVAETDELLLALKGLRTRLAQEQNVPGYIVFSNAALSDMAARRPRNLEEFLEVSGVGRKKAEQYGKIFLETIAQFL